MKIKHGQFLGDVIESLETNSIYHKKLTSIGATTLELSTKRHSIILEPNVPVIIGKKSKSILGVHEGVGVDRVVEYLLFNKVKHKKILVTPESFYKVKEAVKLSKMNLYEDFFLLFDECDRIIKDIEFRNSILLPMDDFFKFKNKAFISATAIRPSDPLFDKHDFKDVLILPDFDFKKDLELITTNNVQLSLKKILREVESENYCIFLNSTKLIGSYVKKLELLNESAIFCSKKATYNFKIAKFKNTHEHLKDFKKYNFFTSRFFSAVDIYMDTPPVVIMISEIKTSPHSMIDPFTDAVQIVGRFRKGVGRVIHITNLDDSLEAMTKDEVFAYLNGCETSYNQIKSLRNGATNNGAKDTLNEALRLVPFANYLNEDGTKNFYMQDYTVHDEKVKHCYINSKNLIDALGIEHFKVNHKEEKYPLDDLGNKKLSSGLSLQNIVTEIVKTLDWALTNLEEFTLDNRNEVLIELNKYWPFIVHAYKELGSELLLKNSYSMKQIIKTLKRKKQTGYKSNFEFIEALNDELLGETAPTFELLSKFGNIICDYDLDLRPSLKSLSEYFKLSKRKTLRWTAGVEMKGYTVLKSHFTQ
ncbi:DEAD/DEAH box helicase family protein [Pedobacter arcticus]|uniref:DEAD/DEAH box helicase family protein n=1 Tax=Pedobacter arcticus TaxID=752140 RepID=UPI000316C411|nr:DEAD/DEAH box helicase family protein [Pedobacter arcticus]